MNHQLPICPLITKLLPSKFNIRYSISDIQFIVRTHGYLQETTTCLFLAFQLPPTTGKTVAIIGLPLCGSANRPTLHFLSLSATNGGIFVTNLLPSKFNIRYSIFDIQFIARTHGYLQETTPCLFLAFQLPPTTGKTVAIIGLPLCGSANRPTLHFLSLSATNGGIFVTNLLPSKFNIRYSISDIQFIVRTHGYLLETTPCLFLAFQLPPTTGKTVAIIGLPLCGSANRPTLHFLSLFATYGGIFVTNLLPSKFNIRYSISDIQFIVRTHGYLQETTPCLFLAFQLPPTTGKTVAIIGLPLCGSANRPTLHFLSLSATNGGIFVTNLLPSKFNIRYSISDIQFIVRTHGYLQETTTMLIFGFPITTNHGQNRGYHWATALRFCE